MIQKKKFSEAIAANISVVEGLIKPLKLYDAPIGPINDLNNYTEYGLYITGTNPSSVINGPSNLKGARANILVFGYGKERILQVIITDIAEIAARFKIEDVWTTWKNNL